MPSPNTIIALLLLAIVSGSMLSGPVLSQPAPPTAARQPALAPMDRVERHISTLHSQLAITSSQQPQWDAFAAAMRANARRMAEAHTSAASSPAPPDALFEMRAYAAATRLHAEDIDRLLPAFEALYITMTPDQRTKADKIFHQSHRDSRRHDPD